MSRDLLRLPVRYFQIPRNYGPGMKEQDGIEEGHQERVLEKQPGQCGLVLVHCWNLGESDGPYPIPDDQEPTGTNSDWVIHARDITSKRIAPVLDAARSVQMPVFHLAAPGYAHKYSQYLKLLEDDELKAPEGGYDDKLSVRPRSVEEEWALRFGPGWPGAVWETHPDSFNISKSVRPRVDENVVLDGWQLSGLCRRMDVDTLIFAGFMANICLLHVPGAMIEMAHKFRYNCVALRDCTVAHEVGTTWDDGTLTKAALHYIEISLGGSMVSGSFLEACAQLTADGR